MAQIIWVFSPTFLDWLLAIRRIYIAYRNSYGFYPSLIFPIRFSEKMQWRKLFDLNPAYSILCDKLAIRDFVRERVGTGAIDTGTMSGTRKLVEILVADVVGMRGRPKGNEDVREAARAYTKEAIEKLAYWMRQSKDGKASIMAADKLLDRAWGKPSQDVKLQAELHGGICGYSP